MVKIGTKFSSLCLNRIRPLARVRSPPNAAHFTDSAGEDKIDGGAKDDCGGDCKKMGGRKIMIVVDTSLVAKHAVHWVLSHAVQNQDLLILLTVINPSKQGLFLLADLGSVVFFFRKNLYT